MPCSSIWMTTDEHSAISPRTHLLQILDHESWLVMMISGQHFDKFQLFSWLGLLESPCETFHRKGRDFLHFQEWLLQDHSPQPNTDDLEAECEMLNDIDLTLGSKETFVLEVTFPPFHVQTHDAILQHYHNICLCHWWDDSASCRLLFQVDDVEDVDGVSVLLDPPVPEGFEVCNTERMPGVANLVNNLQVTSPFLCHLALSSVRWPRFFPDVHPSLAWAGERCLQQGILSDIWQHVQGQCFLLSVHQPSSRQRVSSFSLCQSLYFKLRTMAPCALCHINFDVDIPEEDEVQVRFADGSWISALMKPHAALLILRPRYPWLGCVLGLENHPAFPMVWFRWRLRRGHPRPYRNKVGKLNNSSQWSSAYKLLKPCFVSSSSSV